MTEDKARKRSIRKRMAKTGERYTAARRHLTPTQEPLADLPVSDASVRRGTGKGWDEWFRILDEWGATSHDHTKIARHVNTELGVDGWWAQSVTVGYERARGMRAPNQRPEGFEVSVSKTVALPAMEAWRAFVEPGRRKTWLDLPLRMRTGTRTVGRSARFDVPSEGTRVNAYFDAKGDDRSVVTVTHVKLADAADVAAHRADWKARLGRLAAMATQKPVATRGARAS
jgi:hypothetical protein